MTIQLPPEFQWPLPNDFSHQSFEVPGTRKPGQTGHYRNSSHPELLKLSSASMPYKTTPELFAYSIRMYGDTNPCLGHLPILSPATATQPAKFATHYVWETYGEVNKRRTDLGAGIQVLFERGEVKPNDEGLETVGVWSINRPEWQIIDMALTSYARISVSLYDTLGPDAVEYIINHAGLQLVFTTANHIPSLLAATAKCPCVRIIVSIDDLDTAAIPVVGGWAKEKGVKVMTLREVEKLGRENPRKERAPKPDDIATISYTSGTTGPPKGVVLTHRNVCIGVHSHAIGSKVDERGTFFSYLPLAHIYGRTHELLSMSLGLSLGYYTGDLNRMLEDVRILQPHFFISVPRVLNRIYGAIKAQMDAGGVAGMLLKKGLEVKIKNLHTTGTVTNAFWDTLVFRKVKALLGGRIQVMASGAAPISGEVLDTLKVAFSCEVLQGYGMTENAAAASHVFNSDPFEGGTIGPPSPGNEIKLIDVPAMGYTSVDKPNSRGEICLRGENCFVGYYKDEKNTKETIDEEGWVHTGDVAEMDHLGRLRIIDRIKNIMKLSQGEYVAMEKIESAYAMCPLIAQMYVHGDGLRDHLIAVVVPDPAHLARLASKVLGTSVDAEDEALEAAIREQKVVDAVQDVLNAEAKRHGLKGFETVKRIHLSLEPFSVENGVLTPTLKLRRKDAYERYKDALEALYNLPPPTDKVKAKL